MEDDDRADEGQPHEEEPQDPPQPEPEQGQERPDEDDVWTNNADPDDVIIKDS